MREELKHARSRVELTRVKQGWAQLVITSATLGIIIYTQFIR